MKRGALRVVAGSARGLRLDVPSGTTTRPTSDRVREAVFNALDSLGAVEGARTLDAFAGSGALGIEALSRGAEHVTFCEVDPKARAVLGTNLTHTKLDGRATVGAGDGARLVATGPWDLVLLDPPYAHDGWGPLLVDVARGLADDGVAVIESDREIELPTELEAVRLRRYGGTVVVFASRTGAGL